MICRVQFELILSFPYVRNIYAENRTKYCNGNILSETSVNPFSYAGNISSRNTLVSRKRNFRFLHHFCQNFAWECWRNIARVQKNKPVSRAVKLGRMLTCFIRVWGSGLSWYIKSNHKKEIQWGEEEREKSSTGGSVCLDGLPVSQKQLWKDMWGDG